MERKRDGHANGDGFVAVNACFSQLWPITRFRGFLFLLGVVVFKRKGRQPQPNSIKNNY